MVQMTMHVSDDFADRFKSIGPWLPNILELSLIGFKSLAAAAASEVIEFLSRNPSDKEMLDFHVSERSQSRLQRLLTLNEAGLLSKPEELELDELQRLEHAIVMLKARIAAQAQKEH